MRNLAAVMTTEAVDVEDAVLDVDAEPGIVMERVRSGFHEGHRLDHWVQGAAIAGQAVRLIDRQAERSDRLLRGGPRAGLDRAAHKREAGQDHIEEGDQRWPAGGR